MSKQLTALKVRIYPTKKQRQELAGWFGCARLIYNKGLEERISEYRNNKKSITYAQQQNKLPPLKKRPEFDFLNRVPSQSLQISLRYLDRAFQGFFKGRSAFPKFHKKHARQSITIITPQSQRGNALKKTGKRTGKIRIPKSIKELTFRDKSFPTSLIHQIIISEEAGIYHASIMFEPDEAKILKLPIGKTIGIDRGIHYNVATSEGVVFKAPKNLKKERRRIAKFQRQADRKVKKSRNASKAKKKRCRQHMRVANIRKNFNHQTTHHLTTENQGCCFVLEDLKLKNMSRSAKGTKEKPGKNVKQKRSLNRALLNASLGQQAVFLDYKAKRTGSKLVKVDPKFTSRICSSCGFQSKENRKTQAKFHCQKCGFAANADVNAAINIAYRWDTTVKLVEGNVPVSSNLVRHNRRSTHPLKQETREASCL